MTTTLTQEARTKDGTTAIRVTSHHGNTWIIREAENRFYAVELHPTLDITDFHAHVAPTGLGQPKYRVIDSAGRVRRPDGSRAWNLGDGWYTETQLGAESRVKERLRKEPSLYVSNEHLSYTNALKGLRAVLKKYERWLSFDDNVLFGPVLVQDWSLVGDPSPWAVVWEECSPDEWALKWGSIRREDPTGLFMEPLCSFALSVCPGE
jgi:hypothetical protein